ncbi:MAG: hypothetical protein RIG63_01175 [Coleofasciculus chthonoplastes F3-SA18-01]
MQEPFFLEQKLSPSCCIQRVKLIFEVIEPDYGMIDKKRSRPSGF